MTRMTFLVGFSALPSAGVVVEVSAAGVAAVAAAKRPTLKSPEEVKPPTRLHKEAGHE